MLEWLIAGKWITSSKISFNMYYKENKGNIYLSDANLSGNIYFVIYIYSCVLPIEWSKDRSMFFNLQTKE